MFEGVPKAAFSVLAGNAALRRLASRYGMQHEHSFARRFVAGETIDEVMQVAAGLEEKGLSVTLDYLGEQATSTDAATAATREYLDVIEDLRRLGAGTRSLSVKLTQLGVDVDRATSVDNLRRILDAAGRAGFFVRIDMEKSTYTEQTLEAVETLWHIGYQNSGVAIQAYLRRSAADVDRLNALGTSVRLVKGAYHERPDTAFPHKTEVDAAYVRLMKALLEHGHRPAIATHDPVMIAETKQWATHLGLGTDRFEFEMLYGVRRDLQLALAAEGYAVRIYLPFGRQWFPYFMRRLGERPANVNFVLKSLFRERRS